MNYINKTIFFVVASLLCVSCAREVTPAAEYYGNIRLTLGAAEVKTSLNTSTLKVDWVAGDVLSLWMSGTSTTMDLVAQGSGQNAEFKGSSRDIDVSKKMFVLYPSSSFAPSSGNTSLVLSNASSQTGLLSDFGKYNACFSGELTKSVEGAQLSLSYSKALTNVYSILKFNITSGVDIRKIEIKGFTKNGSAADLVGTLSVDPNTPSISRSVAGNVLTISRSGNAINGDVYAFVNPCLSDNDSEVIEKLYFKFTNASGQICEFTNYISSKLTSGVILDLGSIGKFTFRDEGQYVVRGGEKWVELDQKKDIKEGSALDFSSFTHDAPAGQYGRVRAVNKQLQFYNKYGTQQYFYGCNLTTSACAPDKAHSDQLAARLARIGYNTVRFHHYDALWKENASEDGETYRDRMDYLAYNLIQRGLYISIDLHSQRKLTYSELGLSGSGEMSTDSYKFLALTCAAISGDSNARSQGLLGAWDEWCSFADSILDHTNPYTGKKYSAEPAMVLLNVLNEPSLSEGWKKAVYNLDPVMYAWNKCFPKSTPDPSKQAVNSDNWKTFISYIQTNGYKNMVNYCKNTKGCIYPISVAYDYCCWVCKDAFDVFDILDSHSYVDHPSGSLPAKTMDGLHPLTAGLPDYVNSSSSHYIDMFNLKSSIPHTLTEWNHCAPNSLRALGAMLGGAYMRNKSWSAVWRFAYSQSKDISFQDGQPISFDVARDEVMKASEAAMVNFYLRGDVTDPSSQVSYNSTEFSVNTSKSIALYRDDMGSKTVGILSAKTSVYPATILLTSMDNKALSSSSKMLLVNITDCAGKEATYTDATKKVTVNNGTGNHQLIRISQSDISITLSDASSFKVYELDTDGSRVSEVPSTVSGGKLCFTVNVRGSDGKAHLYYEIVK